jgi:hypothetical protein
MAPVRTVIIKFVEFFDKTAEQHFVDITMNCKHFMIDDIPGAQISITFDCEK